MEVGTVPCVARCSAVLQASAHWMSAPTIPPRHDSQQCLQTLPDFLRKLGSGWEITPDWGPTYIWQCVWYAQNRVDVSWISFSFPSLMRQAIFWCHFTEQPIFSQQSKTAELLSANEYFSWLPRTGKCCFVYEKNHHHYRHNNASGFMPVSRGVCWGW